MALPLHFYKLAGRSLRMMLCGFCISFIVKENLNKVFIPKRIGESNMKNNSLHIHTYETRTQQWQIICLRGMAFFGMWCLPHNLSILGTDGAYAKFHAVVIGCQGKNS